ncbi:hypothetical protein BFW01_g4983 [Lasiodiplodia theobromae]|nr:hypothetical protein BFW01_g4983 [Lasiodiplodia theobromae]
MPTIGQRMHKLKKVRIILAPGFLAQLLTRLRIHSRLGPGAAVLPKDVKKITMRFAPKIDDGHRGPKKFFRTMLPRLQYRNPALRITVDRTAAQSDPAVMNIIFSSPSSSATTSTEAQPATTSANRTVTIQMKHKTESEILQQLYEATGAQEVEPTEVEKEELQELKEYDERSRRDSERQTEVNRQRKREAEMLAAARGGVALNPS